ncbi:MAG: S9 family peptidase [Chloroflexi bacterium]|nr:S9 family peptidase [Chloroflexota bacterium]
MNLTIDQINAMRPVVLPELPQWSRDGNEIALVLTLGGEPEIWSVRADGGFPTRLTTGLGGVRFLGSRSPRRSPDGKWIAYIAETNDAAEVWLWSAESGAMRQLTRLGANIGGMSWSPDSQTLVIANNRYGNYNIYRVEIADGATTRLTTGALYDVYPVFTPDNQHIVFVRMNEAWTDHAVTIIPARGGTERLVARDTNFFDYHYGLTFGYPLVAPDGKTVLFRSHRSGYINYWQVSMNGGVPTQLAPEDADQSEATWSPDGSRVAYISNHNGTLELRVVARDGTKKNLVAPTLGACALPQWSPDGSRLAYLFQTPTTPSDLWVVDVVNGATRQLTNAMIGGNAHDQLITPEKIAYKSFDGLEIHAYLYKPSKIPAGKKCPGILWIHGGPTSQWSDLFYGHTQYFAQQGYVVLMPNIRGSTGYGRAFEDLNLRDYGGGDLKDAVAGAEFLKTLDYIDANKIAITGTSYGGNLSMAAVCFAPNAFQAAIAMSGYGSQSDRMKMDGEDEQELRHRQRLRYALGDPEKDADVYRRVSPLYFTKNVTTPTFVLHGEGRRPRSNACRDFAQALEKEYKTVRYKAYPNEGYYVMSPKNTRQMWLDMIEFLNQYLGD